jgi:hypothetical protein
VTIHETSEGLAETRAENYAEKAAHIVAAVAAAGDASRFKCGARSILLGAELCRNGFTVSDALEAALWRGIDDDTKNKLQRA